MGEGRERSHHSRPHGVNKIWDLCLDHGNLGLAAGLHRVLAVEFQQVIIPKRSELYCAFSFIFKRNQKALPLGEKQVKILFRAHV
jgi:hypothetical protein